MTFDGVPIDDAEVNRCMRKLHWLRMRCHLADLIDRSSPEAEESGFKIYNSTDRDDPAPGVRYGTAGWALMERLARLRWTSLQESAAREDATKLLRGERRIRE